MSSRILSRHMLLPKYRFQDSRDPTAQSISKSQIPGIPLRDEESKISNIHRIPRQTKEWRFKIHSLPNGPKLLQSQSVIRAKWNLTRHTLCLPHRQAHTAVYQLTLKRDVSYILISTITDNYRICSIFVCRRSQLCSEQPYLPVRLQETCYGTRRGCQIVLAFECHACKSLRYYHDSFFSWMAEELQHRSTLRISSCAIRCRYLFLLFM